jgi:hypothetical protein
VKPTGPVLLPPLLVGIVVALALPLGASVTTATASDSTADSATASDSTADSAIDSATASDSTVETLPDLSTPDTVDGESSAGPVAIPAGCEPATPYDGSPDVPGDYRCAGLALDFHHDGPGHSRHPIWAGQYLFVDETGGFHRGTCVFNLGTHPLIDDPSYPVALDLPRDPDGRRAGYLLWRYGSTADDLTAAAVWAVMHYYARDAGGSKRSQPASAPLVPSLDMLAAATGRADLQERALALAAEADRLFGLWTVDLTLAPDGTASLRLLAEATPVPAFPIELFVSGSDTPLSVTTGDDGTATVTVPLPLSGTVTVAAVVDAPGRPAGYRGTPAVPSERGAQTLATAGAEVQLTVSATLEVTPPSVPPTVPETVAPTAPPTTAPPTTDPATTPPTKPATTPAATVWPPTTDDMPTTGGTADGVVAYLATASLVGGIGLVGTLRRRGTAP